MPSESERKERYFETTSDLLLVAKWWIPLISFFAVGSLLPHTRPVGMLALCSLGLAAIFNLTLVSIRVGPESVEYRRWLKWRRLSYYDILESEDSRIPGFAFIKPRRFVAPWGRLYFMRESSKAMRHPSLAGGRGIADYITNRLDATRPRSAGVISSSRPHEVRGGGQQSHGLAGFVAATVLGGLWGLLLWGLTPLSAGNYFAGSRASLGLPLRITLRWLELSLVVTRWPLNVITASVILLAARSFGFKKTTWGLAGALAVMVAFAARGLI